MTVLIVLPTDLDLTLDQKQKWVDDFVEAVLYEKKTGFATRVVLNGWDKKNNIPIYEKIPDDEITDAEIRYQNQLETKQH